MALDYKVLLTRSLSSVVFVALLLGCIMWNYYSFSILFFVISLIGLKEFYTITDKLAYGAYSIAGLVSGAILYFSFFYLYVEGGLFFSLKMLITFVILPVLLFGFSVFDKDGKSLIKSIFTLFGIAYVILPFSLLIPIADSGGEYEPKNLLGIIFLIWSNDTFAYLGGSIFGKRKLLVRISPGKTWEGTIFGVLCSFGISFLIRNYIIGDDGFFWPLLGIIVPVLATVGDLFESLLKRRAGIKDSGNIMPGHGGVLDRFDSLIFVSPFACLLFEFFGK